MMACPIGPIFSIHRPKKVKILELSKKDLVKLQILHLVDLGILNKAGEIISV